MENLQTGRAVVVGQAEGAGLKVIYRAASGCWRGGDISIVTAIKPFVAYSVVYVIQ